MTRDKRGAASRMTHRCGIPLLGLGIHLRLGGALAFALALALDALDDRPTDTTPRLDTAATSPPYGTSTSGCTAASSPPSGFGFGPSATAADAATGADTLASPC